MAGGGLFSRKFCPPGGGDFTGGEDLLLHRRPGSMDNERE